MYICSSVSMIPEGTKDNILEEVKKQILEIYWKFAKAFTKHQFDKVSSHWTYNHKIDSLSSQQLPYSSIYTLLEDILKTLHEYNKEIL